MVADTPTTELCYRFFCAAIERLAFENDPPCVHFNVKLFRKPFLAQ